MVMMKLCGGRYCRIVLLCRPPKPADLILSEFGEFDLHSFFKIHAPGVSWLCIKIHSLGGRDVKSLVAVNPLDKGVCSFVPLVIVSKIKESKQKKIELVSPGEKRYQCPRGRKGT